MPTTFANLVEELSTTTGTGNQTLDGARNARQTFNAAFGIGGTDKFPYAELHQSLDEWEVGTGHLLNSTTLVRDTVEKSSNANNLVNFSAGTKIVLSGPTAADMINTIRKNISADLTVGFTETSFSLGTKTSNFTPNISDGNKQHVTIGGTVEIAVPADATEGSILMEVTIDATPRTITLAAAIKVLSGTLDGTANAINIIDLQKQNSQTTAVISQVV